MNFDISEINSSFSSLIGFNQRKDESYPAYDNDLVTSDSGLKVDDHALFSIENIYNVAAPNFNDMTLGSGETVDDEFNSWLRGKLEQSQVNLLNKLFSMKKGLHGQSKELFQDVRLFDNTRDLTRVVTNQGDFVGLEIIPERMDGIAIKINRIGTHFDGNVTVPVKIFHSSKIDAVDSTNINHTTPNSYKWTAYNQTIRYNSASLQPGGRYYIGYFQSDLGSVKAIKQDINFDRMCYGCSHWNKIWQQKYSRYMSVHNVKVSSGNLNGEDYWERPEYATITSDNFGINLDIAVVSDLTQFFIKNKGVLAYPYKLQVQIDLLEEMYNSNRDTHLRERIKGMVSTQLNTENKGGLMSEYIHAFKALDFDYSGLGSYALNSNRRGIKIRPV